MFDRAWIENELQGAYALLHRTEGAISVLEQMLKQLEQPAVPDNHNGAGESAPALITLDDLQDMLPEGHTIEGEIQPHED